MIVRTPDNKILLLTKGADTMVYQRLAANNPLETVTQEYLDSFAQVGLRTLVLAMRELTQSEYNDWSKEYDVAATALSNR